MISMNKLLRAILFIIILLTVFSLLAMAATKKVIREYPVPEHGLLLLNMPEEWNVTYYEPGDKPYPIIIIYPEEKPHSFQLTLSPLWDNSIERDISNLNYIRTYVERIGHEILAYSDQDELVLKELKGEDGQGFFFDLSDSGAPEGEFKYLSQGALSVGEILLVFSFFSNKENDANRQHAIEMVEGAIQQHQRHVNLSSRQ